MGFIKIQFDKRRFVFTLKIGHLCYFSYTSIQLNVASEYFNLRNLKVIVKNYIVVIVFHIYLLKYFIIVNEISYKKQNKKNIYFSNFIFKSRVIKYILV